MYLFPSENFEFQMIDSKLVVNISEYEIQNEDDKVKAFHKELKLKTKV